MLAIFGQVLINVRLHSWNICANLANGMFTRRRRSERRSNVYRI